MVLVLAAGCGGSSSPITSGNPDGGGENPDAGVGSITASIDAVGTFTFDAVPATGGATNTLHVSNGRFDVTF